MNNSSKCTQEVSLRNVQLDVQKDVERDILDSVVGRDLKIMMYAGLLEEAGEVSGILKRQIRRNSRDVLKLQEKPQWLAEELGDVLWYLAGLANVMGLDLTEIWRSNREKLEERYGRSVDGTSV